MSPIILKCAFQNINDNSFRGISLSKRSPAICALRHGPSVTEHVCEGFFIFVQPGGIMNKSEQNIDMDAKRGRSKNVHSIKAGNISVSVDGLKLTIGNSFFSASFNSAVGASLTVNGENIIANLGGHKTFYVDYNNGANVSFQPDTLSILEQRDDFAHVAYYQTSNNAISIEQHYIVNANVSGLYNYIVIKNLTQNTLSVGEFRFVCRFNPALMPIVNNGKLQMTPPLYADLETYTKVQDETWQLPDGTYYSKYDLADYVRERDYFGVLGGGKGAWIINASHEYFSGGPLKQDLLVHSDAIMIVYMSGAHFGTPDLEMPAGFSKMYGPWLSYFNQGTDNELVDDVKRQAEEEKSAWPYNWVNDDRYPFGRGTVSGSVSGVKCAIVLSPQDEVFDMQVRGYSYNTETNQDGTFSLKDVRPGAYTLSAYPIAGASAGTVQQTNCNVTQGQNYDAGNLVINEPEGIIWQLGETDRRSDTYLHCNELRNYYWGLTPPENITFVIGQSNPATDWVYAQNKKGVWSIEFQDTNDGRGRSILMSISGASTANGGEPRLNVSINGNQLTTLAYDNDHAIYRGANQSGNYHFDKIDVPAQEVLTGQNTLSLELSRGSVMYDTIVYTSSSNIEAKSYCSIL